MNIGTKSLLFGSHQFILHPICVALAWHRLYKRWPEWWQAICIVVHDWGYWGCGNMDGEEGTNHPERGAEIACCLMIDISKFVWRRQFRFTHGPVKAIIHTSLREDAWDLCAGHSRHYAKLHNFETSPLMAADKMGIIIPPWWIHLPMFRASGELTEYRSGLYHQDPEFHSDKAWYLWLQEHLTHMAQEDAARRT